MLLNQLQTLWKLNFSYPKPKTVAKPKASYTAFMILPNNKDLPILNSFEGQI